MQKARRHPSEERLRPLVSVWFQVLFHSPSRRSFHLSLTVLVHYRSYSVFSLAGWCRPIRTGFLRSRPTQGIPPPRLAYVYRPVTFCGAAFQSASSSLGLACVGPTTPCRRSSRVWAGPRSLATTWGITDLFSVPPPTEMFQFGGCASRCAGCPGRSRGGFPHSDTCGSGLFCSSPQLFAALHVLHRLSMPRHPPYALGLLSLI